jgi:hypothetical protein
MKVELHSGEPDLPLRPRLEELAEGAVRVDIAVAFVSKFGAKQIHSLIDRLKGQSEVRLLVSVLFPTDLDAIAKLAERIEVLIHLGFRNRAEKIHGQFHSKVVLIERIGEPRTILVGSHNWTENGLEGENLEASIVVECVEKDPIARHTREHIDACRRSPATEPFDPSRIDLYRTIQREFHSGPRSAETMGFSGFEESEGIVILAEANIRKLGESGELYFNVPLHSRRQFGMEAPVQIFVFPQRSLLDKKYPLPEAHVYCGKIQNTDSRQNKARRIGGRIFLISEINRPLIEVVSLIPPRRPGEMQVIVPFKREGRSKGIPLFLTGGEPRAVYVVDFSEMGRKTDAEIAATDHRHTSTSRSRMVPSGLIAEMKLKLPFEFLYPPRMNTSLEDHARTMGLLRSGARLRVIALQSIGISEYVSAIKWKSDPNLTNLIYSHET